MISSCREGLNSERCSKIIHRVSITDESWAKIGLVPDDQAFLMFFDEVQDNFISENFQILQSCQKNYFDIKQEYARLKFYRLWFSYAITT